MLPITWTKNRGRNGWDSPLDVEMDRSVESLNVHFYNGGLGTKRGGSVVITESGPVGHLALIEYVPAQDLTAAELFIVDASRVSGLGTTIIWRCVTGSSTAATTTALTLSDALTEFTPLTISSAVLNGKLYLAFDSAVNRLHVFDPNTSTLSIRRAGVGTPAAPTGSDDGAGALSLSRSYKVAYIEQQSGIAIRRSELSAALTRTIAAKAGSTITKPSSLGEGETHWELYAADTATGTYYLMATTLVGTTTYDDTAATIDTSAEAEPTAGSNTPFPSVKSLATDGKRLLGFGVWETTAGDSVTPKNGRVYFTPVLDSSSTHDDEHLSNTTTNQGFLDVARNTGAVDVGLTPRPVNNVFYAFQSTGVYALIPTESAIAPFRRAVMDPAIGATSLQSIVMASDQNGKACAYFLDPTKGPYTVGGPNGLAWCGKDVKDLWDRVNRDAASPPWGLWYPDRTTVLFAVALDGANTNNALLVLDVTELTPDDHGDLRGGWSVWNGDIAQANCGVTFSNTLAATRSRVRVPYVGLTAGTTLLRYDESTDEDHTTPFQAYVTSGVLAQDTTDVEVQRSYLAATAENGVTIQQSFVRNFGDETDRTSEVILTPDQGETTVLRKFDDAALQDAWAVQVTLGDADAVASAWTLYQWRSELKTGAPR